MAKEHMGTRLERAEIERVEAFAKAESKPGFELTTSKAIRLLILRGLDAARVPYESAPKKGRAGK